MEGAGAPAAAAAAADGAPGACAVPALPLYEREVHGEEGLLPEGAAAAGRYFQGRWMTRVIYY